MEEDFLEINFDQSDDFLFSNSIEENNNTKEEQKENDVNHKEVTENSNEKQNSESVGDDEDKDKELEDSSNQSESSPNHISSIAAAFRDAGVLQTLEQEDINNIQSADDFRDALDKEIANRLDESSKRIYEALNYKIPASTIQTYENSIKELNNVTDDMLEDESDNGIGLRKKLIMINYINKGLSEREAESIYENSCTAGNEIDYAKSSLIELRDYYNKSYDEEIKNAKKANEEHKKNIQKQSETLKKSIMEDDALLNQLDVSKGIRSKIFDTISKPIGKDSKGNPQTKLQKYISENSLDFYKYVGTIFELTDCFKSFDKLISTPLKNAQKKNNDKLKSVLNSTKINEDGSLKFQHGVSADNNNPIDISTWNLG